MLSNKEQISQAMHLCYIIYSYCPSFQLLIHKGIKLQRQFQILEDRCVSPNVCSLKPTCDCQLLQTKINKIKVNETLWGVGAE